MEEKNLKVALKDLKPLSDTEAKDLEKISEKGRVTKFNLSDLLPISKIDDDGDEELFPSEAWKVYKKLEDSLSGNELMKYIQVNASPIIKDKKGITKLIGLKMERDKPISETLISVRNARLMNDQIFNTANHPSGRYYYLLMNYFNL